MQSFELMETYKTQGPYEKNNTGPFCVKKLGTIGIALFVVQMPLGGVTHEVVDYA